MVSVAYCFYSCGRRVSFFMPMGQKASLPNKPPTQSVQPAETIAFLAINGESLDQKRVEDAFDQYLAQQTQAYQQFGQDLGAQLNDAGDGAYLKLTLKATALQQLMDDVLFRQEQGKRKISASKEEVEEKFKQDYQEVLNFVKARYDWDEQGLVRFLKEQRQQELAQFQSQIREQALQQLLLAKTKEAIGGQSQPTEIELISFIQENRTRYEADILGEVPLDEAQVKAFYEKNKSIYAKTLYKTSHILIAVDKDAANEKVEEAQKKAENIRDKIVKQNVDFAQLAKEVSDDPGSKELGGDLGMVDKETPFVPKFLEALFKLEAGQVSTPVRSQFGFHLIKAVEKKESTFEDVKEEVESAYTAERQDQLFQEWIDAAKKHQASHWDEISKTVRDDFVANARDKKVSEWLTQARNGAKLVIRDELLRAALLGKEGKPDEALALYAKLSEASSLSDPYTPYYAARIYQAKLTSAETRKAEIEKSPSPAQATELKKITDEIALFTQKTLIYLTKTIEGPATGNARLFDTLLGLDDQNPLVHYKYGVWLYGENTLGESRTNESDKTREALAHIKRAIELKPNYADALVLYGNILSANGNFGTAVEYYEQALPLMQRPALLQLQEKLADAYLGLEQWDQAKALYTQLNKIQPDNIKFIVALGDVAYATGAYVSAQNFYKTAFEKEPTKIDYSLKLAKSAAKTGATEEAIKMLSRVTKDSPYLGEAWLELGELHKTHGSTEEALLAYREGFSRTAEKEILEKLGEAILVLAPNDSVTRLKLASVYKSQYIYENAIQHYEQILTQNTSKEQKLETYEGLAESMRGRAEYEKARDYYVQDFRSRGLKSRNSRVA